MNNILDNQGLAHTEGTISVYNYDAQSLEYIGQTAEFLSVGVGIPANACLDKPLDAKQGFAVVRDITANCWIYLADHRGEQIYHTETGDVMIVNELGDYPENTTRSAPQSSFDKWNGTAWITDTQAQQQALVSAAEQQKNNELMLATQQITTLQDAVDLEMATAEEVDALTAWKKYRVLLSRIDPVNAPTINWPQQP